MSTKGKGKQRMQFPKLYCRKSHYVYLIILVLILCLTIPTVSRIVKRDITDADGNRYVGEMEGRIKQGFGRYEMVDGTVYEGEFKNDLPHGEGNFHFGDNSYYIGQFQNGLPHGHGTYSMSNGDVYIGSMVKGELNGNGVYTYEATGSTFEGTFLDGVRHGFGTLTEADGSQYIGGFVHDLKEGLALEIDGDLDEFRGFFRNGVKHGEGVVIIVADGVLRFQSWNTGRLELDETIVPIENCRLTIDGMEWMFKGNECIDGLAHGEGRAIALDGSAYINHGVFVLGKLIKGITTSLQLPILDE